ncbi:MAG: hypothetical protein KGI33_07670 [Thaumarchaeota archaeon]|nr:hypothetical protein [Nitrososphaerota archaeon]
MEPYRYDSEDVRITKILHFDGQFLPAAKIYKRKYQAFRSPRPAKAFNAGKIHDSGKSHSRNALRSKIIRTFPGQYTLQYSPTGARITVSF